MASNGETTCNRKDRGSAHEAFRPVLDCCSLAARARLRLVELSVARGSRRARGQAGGGGGSALGVPARAPDAAGCVRAGSGSEAPRVRPRVFFCHLRGAPTSTLV